MTNLIVAAASIGAFAMWALGYWQGWRHALNHAADRLVRRDSDNIGENVEQRARRLQ